MDFGSLFSFQGRVGRQTFWLTQLGMMVAVLVVVLVASLFAGASDQTGSSAGAGILGILLLLLYIPFVWIGLAVSAKRWHDRDKSAWWILINFVPLIGGIWALIENGFLRGTEGPNSFGEDPITDY
jgi:uncharacterized membrane protein YhaH (DUF805 family)